MIDWFDYPIMTSIYWVVLSYEIGWTGRNNKVWKPSSDNGGIFPPGSIIDYYDETRDYATSKKMYWDYLMKRENELDIPCAVADIYKHVIAPTKHHCNVCIVYTEPETWVCDALGEFIKDKFAVEMVDLDHLFKHGWVKGFYLDLELIREKSSEIELTSKLLDIHDKIQTSSGRAELMSKMSKKEKIKLLKDLGIKASKSDDVDRMLTEAWVQSDS